MRVFPFNVNVLFNGRLGVILVEVMCPYCQRSLMDSEHPLSGAPSITLLGKMPEDSGGGEGLIRLSSYYGDYTVDTALVIPPGTVVEFFCPYCRNALTSTRDCEDCKAPMVALQFPRGGRVQFCSRRSCKRHLIEFEDPESELREFYRQFSPFLE